MADDVDITPGSGATIATDQVGSRHFQCIKLDLGANGVSVPVDTALPTVGYFVTVSTDVTRPADTTTYANGDCWSDSTSAPTSGGFTLTGAARASGKSGIITDAIICTNNDPATQMQGEIWIFDTAVTNVNDNSPLVVSDSEIKTYIGKIEFTTEDAGNNISYHARNLNIGFTCIGSANLRFLIKVKNAYVPASAEVLTVRLKIMQVD